MSNSAQKNSLATVVTYLRMTENPHVHVAPPVNLAVSLMAARKPPVHFYRYLYEAVGRDNYWLDRLRLSDDELSAIICADTTSIQVAYVDGSPAGYFELDFSAGAIVWLAYFGIIGEFQGRGLGKWLLSQAIASAWSGPDIKALHVETCTLDGPHALPLYQRSGFTPYDRRDKIMDISTPA